MDENINQQPRQRRTSKLSEKIFDIGEQSSPSNSQDSSQAETMDQAEQAEKYSVVVIEDKTGIVDSKGKIVIPVIYDSIFFRGSFFEVKKEEKYGIIDREGKIIIPIVYDFIIVINDIYNEVSINNKYGIIDNFGNLKLSIEFDRLEKLSLKRDLFLARKGNLNSLIEIDGEKTYLPYNISLHTIVFDKYFVGKNEKNKYGAINIEGKIIIPFYYDSVYLNHKVDNFEFESYEDNTILIIDLDGKIKQKKSNNADKIDIALNAERKQLIIKTHAAISVEELKKRAKTTILNIHKDSKTGTYYITNDADKAIGQATCKFDTIEGVKDPVVSIAYKADDPKKELFYFLHDSDFFKSEHTYDGYDYSSRTYDEYRGSYAQDVMGYDDETISDAFEGDPDAYWNID